jgi:hypothetical protein
MNKKIQNNHQIINQGVKKIKNWDSTFIIKASSPSQGKVPLLYGFYCIKRAGNMMIEIMSVIYIVFKYSLPSPNRKKEQKYNGEQIIVLN